MTGIKICGMTCMEDIEAVNRVFSEEVRTGRPESDGFSRPFLCGFILTGGYKRSISGQTASCFRQELDPGISSVGVFVNEGIEQVLSFVREGILDVIQLHGEEDAAYVRDLREGLSSMGPVQRGGRVADTGLTGAGVGIIQSHIIRGEEDIREANASPADLVLLDSGRGSGRCFDWSLIRGMKRPFLLAGGLCPENVRSAVLTCCFVEETGGSLWGLDVSRGVESLGRKDIQKIRAFVRELGTE